jgi:hypothetical protein
MSMQLDGGTPGTLASVQGQLDGIAIDSASIYWADSLHGDIMRVGLDGRGLTTLATGQDYAPKVGLAVDSTSVYWIDVDSDWVETVMKVTPK